MVQNREIGLTFFVLFLSILFFSYSSFDKNIQDIFYNFETNQWVLDSKNTLYHILFYSGLKKVLVSIGVILLLSLIFLRKYNFIKYYKKGLVVVLLSSILIPLFSITLKKVTNMPCPKHEIHYGGTYPHTKIWESYTAEYQNKKKIKCWPAGHASGGFALLSLFFLFKRKKSKVLALSFALSLGWIMGGYKMLIGDHYFSHTWITMIIAWLTILIIVKILNKTPYFRLRERFLS